MNQKDKPFVAGGIFGEEMLQDETDPKATAAIKAFLVEYKALCDKHKCMLLTGELQNKYGEPLIEAAYNPDEAWRHDDHKDIVESTKGRGWKI